MFSCQDLQLFSLNPIVQTPERVSVWRESTKAQHSGHRKEGGAATEAGAERSAREQNCGKGPHRRLRAHYGPHVVFLPHSTRPLPQSALIVLFQPWQKPPLTFSMDVHGVCLLQYDVNRHVWPQLGRAPASRKKERPLCEELSGVILKSCQKLQCQKHTSPSYLDEEIKLEYEMHSFSS